MWELDHNESWEPKTWCFCTLVLEKSLESPLDCQEIKPVNPKGNQSWIFIEKTVAEAEAPTWYKEPTHWKRLWCWERLKAKWDRGNRGWDGWIASRTHGLKFEQTPGDSGGQRNLACYNPWGHEESDKTYQLNNRNKAEEGDLSF